MDPDTVALLGRTIARLGRQLNAFSTPEGLTPSQASVLGALIVHGPMTPTALADFEGVNPTMLSRMVAKLADLRLIEREPDPRDLRSSLLSATEEGKRANTRIKERRAVTVSACLNGIPAGDRASIEAALGPLQRLSVELGNRTHVGRR